MNSTELKYKAERVGILLARSPLDQEIKDIILDNLGLLREKDIDYLLASLHREEQELKSFALKLNAFFDKQDADWKKLEKEQKNKANSLLSDFFKELDLERAKDLKESL